MDKPSETPLTDAAYLHLTINGKRIDGSPELVPADFARTLELELTRLRAYATTAAARVAELEGEIRQLEHTVGALRSGNANINDTCRSRGFDAGPSGRTTEDRVIALAQAYDKAEATLATSQSALGEEVREHDKTKDRMREIVKAHDSLATKLDAHHDGYEARHGCSICKAALAKERTK